MSNLQNVTRIKVVYDALQELAGQVVFVGGAVVEMVFGGKWEAHRSR